MTPGSVLVPARERPSIVAAAGYLLYAAAGLYVVNVLIGLATLSGSLKAARDVLAATQHTSVANTSIKIGIFAGIGTNVVVLAMLVLMASFVLRGSSAWRITTFVIAGLGVLCSFCGLAGSGISRLNTASSLTPAQQGELRNAVPAWARDGQFTVSLLIAIALILLARPAANDFFRKPPSA